MAKKTVEEQASSVGDVKKCFVIMPISDVEGYPAGHFGEVYRELIEPAVNKAGYKCELATTTSSAHMIQLDVVTKVATADLCICDLSTSNPNVMFEYGIRQAFDKPTVLIKDDKTRRIFDLSGFRDIEYDHTLRIANTLAARESIVAAINDTVDGANDDEQIFSLVKLMKLTKAALPTGEVNQQDARFTLLENKIDGLANLIAQPKSRGDQASLFPSLTARFGNQSNPNRYLVVFSSSEITIMDTETNRMEIVSNGNQLHTSPTWDELPSSQQKRLLGYIRERSPAFSMF